ncbi:MAG: hypothetical protein JSW65_04280 [Candidatus Bipolaricaulota bacterium]|nr:MAG: hypothetical protein JSW65_04280 [Candidatus Bipolaricaulota bacterium]
MTPDVDDERADGAPRGGSGGDPPAAPEPGQIVAGTIAEADNRRLVVHLESGHRGIARLAGVERTSGEGNGPKIGDAVRVRVLGVTADHQVRVELLLAEAQAAGSDSFDREMDRLSDALRQQSTAVSARNAQRSESIEGRIAGWMDAASAGLERVHEHRSDRLSKEFYDEGKDGGSRAQRRGNR